MTLMTQAAFAGRRGVGKSAVSNWKKAGLVVFGEGDDGKLYVDVERTEARLNAKLDPMRGRPATAEQPLQLPIGDGPIDNAASGVRNLAQARAELVDEDLFGRRLKNAKDAGELVPLAEAERRLAAVGRMIRERIAAEERNVAERLASTSDPRAVMAVLDEARTKAFAALAVQIAGGELDEVDDVEPAEEVAEAA